MINNQEINRRFAGIMNIQAPSLSNPYFLKQIFAMGYTHQFLAFNKHVEERYENIDEFVKYQATVRETLFKDIESSTLYQAFNTMDMTAFKVDQQLKGLHQSIYHERCEDCYYLSLDLKTANFQALKHIHPAIVKDADTYDALVRHYTDDEWIIKSKAFRQAMFGLLNGKRISTVSKWLISQYIQPILNILGCGMENLEVFQMDEIIFKLPNDCNYTDMISKIHDIVLPYPVDVHIELFKIEPFALKNGNKKVQTFYVKTLHNTETMVIEDHIFKGVSSKYRLIAHALFFEHIIEDDFLVFDADGMPNKMMHTLGLEKIRKEG